MTEDLATHLNAKQGKNWKYLAGEMGYSSCFTQNLDLTPTEATQKLLQDWEHKSEATVFALFCLLQKLERDDASAILLPYLTPKNGGEVVWTRTQRELNWEWVWKIRSRGRHWGERWKHLQSIPGILPNAPKHATVPLGVNCHMRTNDN